MFERMTGEARQVVVFAQEESRMLCHNYVGTEHILLGYMYTLRHIAHRAGESSGLSTPSSFETNVLHVSLEESRERVVEMIGRGTHTPPGRIPYTPRAKKVLEVANRLQLQLQHSHVTPDHILLALVQEGESVAVQILSRSGVDLNELGVSISRSLEGAFKARRQVTGMTAFDAVLAELVAYNVPPSLIDEIRKKAHEIPRT